MAMELRLLTPDDAPALDRVRAEAFSGGRRPDTPESPPDPNRKRSPSLGIFDGPRLVAAATIHDLRLTWGETDAPTGGLASVACVADQRGRGHVGRLLEESLRRMRDSGQYLSGLYPFAYAFYRRFGWEWVGEKRTYSVPLREIPAFPEGRALRSYDGPEALETVRPVYDAFARRYRGMSTRTEQRPDFWEQALGHRDGRTTYVQVYHAPETGAPEGYLTFRYPSSGDTGRVGELFANTPAAYRGLLSVLHYYGTQLDKVRFSAPSNDPLPFYVMHHDLETTVTPVYMGRVVDVAAALAALRPDRSLRGRLTLQVADSRCDWNDGTFAVAIEDGGVAVQATREAAGVALDIQALTQAYWGQPPLDPLRAAGRLTVSREEEYSLLARLLPPTVGYLQDGF